MSVSRKSLILGALVVLIAAAGYYVWQQSHENGPGEGYASGNGRIEATEIDVATKLGGRVVDILVDEGAFVKAGDVLGHMQTDTLQAQLAEAQANRQQAINAAASAQAQVAVRQSEKAASEAQLMQRETELANAQQRLQRSESLVRSGATSTQQRDDDRAAMRGAQAAITAAKAQIAAADATIMAAEAQVVGAQSSVKATEATITRIEADIRDSQLVAPRDGRVQYKIAQPGEVLGAGGKVLNLVDLSDVYMTFFLPETVAGRVALGSEARIILDAAPQYVIPATISFVAATAQFTPKTVETASERQKLMFRVRAQIDRELLQKYLTQVKTGLPGVAWVKLAGQADWPEELRTRLPE
ncbi:HlyD family efflux transporter periplasmic adaptor subunit [Verticiella sediminum]|uniref:HlyD family efflux transporter periplasmic adaptor subunit n=1 Tax=Verticiella sediminum TaxID=1247510 RepID=A0A556B089_9BURK|nr:HlyD family efflux transporter periplasmic adaptor subunit [Verticiella sediminum]TSH98597.1 HlyD family efflux transporter periplasmic adaptor subunit [Verticiella sediminum]